MNKCSAFILLACAFGLLTAERVEAAPVEWDFIATGCSTYYQGNGCVAEQHYPVTLATLTLPGPDSSGTARYDEGWPAPVYTGDSFALDWNAYFPPLTPSFYPPHTFCEAGIVCDFGLRWSESGGQLTDLLISVRAVNDVTRGLDPVIGDVFDFWYDMTSGAEVGSGYKYVGPGGLFRGCEDPTCEISGSWTNVSLVPAPEPGSLALLASAFGVWGLIGRRCTQLISPRAR
jgi:predicted outer membrane lipoprotein